MGTLLEQLGVDRMSVADRIELIGLIWDTIADTGPLAIPEWHRAILEERLAEADANPDAGVPWREVMDRLGKKP